MKYNEKCYYKINFIGWQGLFKERETRYSQNNLDLGKHCPWQGGGTRILQNNALESF